MAYCSQCGKKIGFLSAKYEIEKKSMCKDCYMKYTETVLKKELQKYLQSKDKDSLKFIIKMCKHDIVKAFEYDLEVLRGTLGDKELENNDSVNITRHNRLVDKMPEHIREKLEGFPGGYYSPASKLRYLDFSEETLSEEHQSIFLDYLKFLSKIEKEFPDVYSEDLMTFCVSICKEILKKGGYDEKLEEEAEKILKKHTVGQMSATERGYALLSLDGLSKEGRFILTAPEEYKLKISETHHIERNEVEMVAYPFSKREVLDVLVNNKNDLGKTYKELTKMANRRTKEMIVQKKMEEIDKDEEEMKLWDEAERRLYGKVKRTKRKQIPDIKKDSIFKKYEDKCAICGATEGLHIHHKDNNPKNNRTDNLIVLCGVCHKKIHMKVR